MEVLKFKINDHRINATPVFCDVLQELYYIVNFEGHEFVMALDADTTFLQIQGPAPYDARELESEIASTIEAFIFNTLPE